MLSLDEANMNAVVAAGALPFEINGSHCIDNATPLDTASTSIKRKNDDNDSEISSKRTKGFFAILFILFY